MGNTELEMQPNDVVVVPAGDAVAPEPAIAVEVPVEPEAVSTEEAVEPTMGMPGEPGEQSQVI